MKSYHYSRKTIELDTEAITQLCNVLGVTEVPDTTQFMKVNYLEDRTFYQLVAQVLTMQGVSTIIAPDNWEPINLFYQLNRVLRDHKIELLEESENEEYEAYDISFNIDGVHESVLTDTTDPSQLFNIINIHLKDWQFVRLISHLKQRRSVEWLLAPIPFDSERFKQLTGCSELRKEWKAVLTARHSDGRVPKVSQVHKLNKKVFFIPSAFCLVNGKTDFLSYTDTQTGKPMYWAGRVLPGQTFAEAITAELKRALSYSGRFEFYNFKFVDYAVDKTGQKIERYGFTLKLLEPVTVKTTSTGLTIHFTPSPGMRAD